MQPYFLNPRRGHDSGIILEIYFIFLPKGLPATRFSLQIDLKRCVMGMRKWRGEAMSAGTTATSQRNFLLKCKFSEPRPIIFA
jgi:hypothetical protein